MCNNNCYAYLYTAHPGDKMEPPKALAGKSRSQFAARCFICIVRKNLTRRNDNIRKRFNIVSKAYDQNAHNQARKKARTIPATSDRDKASGKSYQEKLKDPIKCAEVAKKSRTNRLRRSIFRFEHQEEEHAKCLHQQHQKIRKSLFLSETVDLSYVSID